MFIIIQKTLILAYKQKQLLSGITIVLDAGHGGMDKGTSVQHVDEASLNFIITKKIEKELINLEKYQGEITKYETELGADLSTILDQ